MARRGWRLLSVVVEWSALLFLTASCGSEDIVPNRFTAGSSGRSGTCHDYITADGFTCCCGKSYCTRGRTRCTQGVTVPAASHAGAHALQLSGR